MNAPLDLVGKQFGRWHVIDYAGSARWNCRCVCGTVKVVDGNSLRRGISLGCSGCAPRGHRRTHGASRTRLYNVWCKMIARCERENDAAFPRYGGRGIIVCPEWRIDFATFEQWARANGYAPGLTIDRRDNNGPYAPENCRWATYAEQNRNYSRNRPIEYRGRTVLVCDLAAEVDLPQDVLKNRIFRYGWDIERAVSTPVMPKGGRR